MYFGHMDGYYIPLDAVDVLWTSDLPLIKNAVDRNNLLFYISWLCNKWVEHILEMNTWNLEKKSGKW